MLNLATVQARKDKKTDPLELGALEKANTALLAGKPVRSAGLTAKEQEAIKTLMPLTLKPVIYAANVADADLATGNAMSEKVFAYAQQQGTKAVLVSAQVGACNCGCTCACIYVGTVCCVSGIMLLQSVVSVFFCR